MRAALSIAFLLHGNDVARDRVGNADAAAARNGLGVFVDLEGAEHAFGRPAAERAVAGHGVENGLQHLGDEHLLELGADLARLLDAATHAARRGTKVDAVDGRSREAEGVHHSTSISAWRAPAALIAWRIAIMSRGPMPSALRPLTSSCSVTLAGSTARRRCAFSSTSMSVRGTTVVTPVEENGLGCETCGVSVTRMVRLPWAMATVLMRTFSPMTMVPERSSMTTLASWSGSTSSCSMSVIRPTMSFSRAGGTDSITVPGSSGRAIGAVMKVLIACAIRRAVVRSGLRSEILIDFIAASWKPSSRSTMPPLAMRPAVGVPLVTLAAEPVALKPDTAIGPWATA